MDRRFRIETSKGMVSALFDGFQADPLVIVAHGAGQDMRAPLLEGFAEGLNERNVSCVRFNFPYKEQGRQAPDAERALRDAWAHAFVRCRKLGKPVFVGGKSLGGRIASLLVADGMPADGLIFLGYPLHPPGKPDRIRDAHLVGIPVPMLFIQGTSDPFARWDLMESLIERLGDRATLDPIDKGDHSFRIRGLLLEDQEIGRQLGRSAANFVLARRR